MIKLTLEQVQQIKEALKEVRFAAIERCDSVIPSCDKALATILAAIAQEQEPVTANCPKCKSEISHWSWCPDFVQPVSQKQEPVAWWFQPPNKNVRPMFDTQQHGGKWKPLYATPVRTKDLTDDEIGDAGCSINVHVHYRDLRFARAVIVADREKNK